MKPFSCILLATAFSCTVLSCRKAHTAAPQSQPASMNITHIIQTRSNTSVSTIWYIAYNSAGAIDTVTEYLGTIAPTLTDLYWFAYNGSNIQVNDEVYEYLNTVYLSGTDMASSLTIGSSSYPYYNAMSYNGSQIVTEYIMTPYPFDTTEIYAYTYNGNGDIATQVEYDGHYDSIITTYKYDTAHATQLGDPRTIGEWLNYGVIWTRSVHLTTEVDGGGTYTRLMYQFDKYGRISSVIETDSTYSGTDTTTSTYQYAN